MEKSIKKINLSSVLYGLIMALFIVYLAALFKILILRNLSFHALMQGNNGFRSTNLIPFKTISSYLSALNSAEFSKAVSNVFGNIIIFIPLGYFLPVLLNKSRKLLMVTVEAIAFSVIIEIVQYFLSVGSSDVDDVILNTIGGCFGYCIYSIIRRFKKNTFYLCLVFITCVMLTGGYIVAKKQFSAQLGMNRIEEHVIGGQDIPKLRADMVGKLVFGSKKYIILVKDKSISGNDKQRKAIAVEDNKNSSNKALINKKTKFYLAAYSLKDNKVTIVYKKVSYKDIASKMINGRNVSVWGKRQKNEFIANTVCVYNQ